VFGLDGSLLGVPDLFDECAGVVGEYDGADHRRLDRRRTDSSREERLRDHGLEYFRVVEGEVADRARLAARMHAVRRRARFLPPDRRRWTLEEPAWYLHRMAG
jgi:very-short-patch-repair endonuclease